MLTQTSINPRSIKWGLGTPGALVVESKLTPHKSSTILWLKLEWKSYTDWTCYTEKKDLKDNVKVSLSYLSKHWNNFTSFWHSNTLKVIEMVIRNHIKRANWHKIDPFTFYLYVPFLWVRFNCLKAAELLQGDSLLLTTHPKKMPI